MLVRVSNDIQITDYDKSIIEYCENTLIINNPEFYTAQALGHWTGNMEEKLYLYTRDDKKITLPYGCLKDIILLTRDKAKFEFDFKDYRRTHMIGNIDLYPYQQKAARALLGSFNGILQAPCGSGKTQIALQTIKEINGKTLWITHTKDLLKQSKDRCEKYFKGDFGTITEGKVDIGRDITFATIQTLSKIDIDKYKYEWDCVVVDECHRVAGTPTKMMQFYKVLNKLAAPRKFGLTATLKRSDGLVESTKAILGDIAYTIMENEVADTRMKATLNVIESDTPASEYYLESDGTFNYMRLGEYLSKNEERNELLIDTILKEYNSGHYCLVLSTRLDHLKYLHTRLGLGEYLDGKTAKKKREKILEDMKTGSNRLLFATFSLAKEGLDIPVLDRLFIAIPNKNYVTIKQAVGRIERKIEGKCQPVVYCLEDVNIPEVKQMLKKIKAIVKK